MYISCSNHFLDSPYSEFSAVLDSTTIPLTYQQAVIIPYWKETIDADIKTLNDTWKMVSSPPNASVIGS